MGSPPPSVAVIEPVLARFAGRLVKHTGDGFLAEFPTVEQAVACAVEMQRALADGPLEFRLGVSLGDVIDDDGDILGEGVNIAARIEALAPPGGVALSDSVWDAACHRAPVTFVDGGLRLVKNLSAPLHIWLWHPDETVLAGAGQGGPRRAAAEVPATLVELPRPAGDIDAATEIAEEFHDALVMSLSRRQGTRVVTEPSGGVAPRYSVSGRCRVSGGRCRLQLNVHMTATHQNIWSRRLDGDASDPDAFVEDAVRIASGELRVLLNAYDGSDIAQRPDEELEVGELLSKAAFLFYRHDPKSTELSRATMERAVALAPDNAMAVAMLAWSLAHMVPYLEDRVADVDVSRAMALADRAIDLNPRLDFAFHTRAWLRLWLRRDHEGCLADVARLLEINPDYHKGPQDRGLAEVFMGRPAEGIAMLGRVIGVAPAEPVVPLLEAVIAIGHLLLGQTEAARRHADEAYGRRPLMRLHGLVHAAAHSDDAGMTASPDFAAMVERLDLRAGDPFALPFATEDQAEMLADLLRRAGVPDVPPR